MTGWLRPHNQQGYSCMRSHALSRKMRKKGAWRTVWKVLAGALSFIMSIAALLISQDAAKSARDAAETAKRAMQIQEATSLLSVAPHIEVVQAEFHPFGDPPYPPHILLYNSGRVDALAVTIEMNIYEGFIHP